MPNRQWLERLDFSMKVVRGHGLSKFLAARRVVPLAATEELYFAEMPAPGGGTRQRACIIDKLTKETRLALQENLDESGHIAAPTWHVCSDMGSVG